MILGTVAHSDKKSFACFQFTPPCTSVLLTAFPSPRVHVFNSFSPRRLLAHSPPPSDSFKETPNSSLSYTDHSAFFCPHSQIQRFRPPRMRRTHQDGHGNTLPAIISTGRGRGCRGFSRWDPPSLVGSCVMIARQVGFLLCPLLTLMTSPVHFHRIAFFLRKWYLVYFI